MKAWKRLINWRQHDKKRKKSFYTKKEKVDTKIKDIRNLFRLKKENEAIKDKIIKYISNILEHGREDCCKPVRVGNFWNNIYTEYQDNGHRSKAL